MESIKIKQNKNKAAILLSIFLIGVSGCLFAFPSYAYTDNSTNGVDFEDMPIPANNYIADAQTAYSAGLYIGNGNLNGSNFYMSVYSSQDNIYCFWCNNRVYYVGENVSNNSDYCYVITNRPDNYSQTTAYGNNVATNQQYNLSYTYCNFSGSWSDINLSIPIFDSINDGVAAVRDWIDNPPAPAVESHRFAGSLAPGYVAVFDVGGLSDINIVLGTTLFSGYKYPGYSTTQAAGMIGSLPSTITLPMSGTSSISWSGSGQKNIIGQYQNFSFTEHVTSTFSSQYYVVVNPLSGTAASGTVLESSSSNRNNNITILIDKVKNYKTYSLTESVSIGNNGWSEDTSSNGGTTTGQWDDDSGAWVGTNDQTNLPENFNDLPVGGGNTPLVNGSNSINDFLQDIANQIKGFFSGAIGAVSTLVGAGSAFINQLIGLYSWLPAPVYSVLSAALILVITIGVIKVFV